MRIAYLSEHSELMPELATWHQAEWGPIEPEESVASRLRSFAECGGAGSFPTAFVAHEGGALLGSAMLLAHDLEGRPELTPWLAGVYVKRERRGQGIASALVQAVIEEATRQALPRLWLYTPHDESLYARLGFQTREHGVLRGTKITLMCLSLRKPGADE
ncbi:MAG TPA: GNAT family N-acetyltransferase [Polyangiales bacterium]